jgi:hypothetical protein
MGSGSSQPECECACAKVIPQIAKSIVPEASETPVVVPEAPEAPEAPPFPEVILHGPRKTTRLQGELPSEQLYSSKTGKTIALVTPTKPSAFIPNVPVVGGGAISQKSLADALKKLKPSRTARDLVEGTCPIGQVLDQQTGQCIAVVSAVKPGMPLPNIPARPASSTLRRELKPIQTASKRLRQAGTTDLSQILKDTLAKRRQVVEPEEIADTWVTS